MKILDWTIVSIYLAGLIALGWRLGKKQSGLHDYFLGSKSIPWWAVGLSTMATQLGAVSFISAPAFAGLRPHGGLIWLGYEFAVPFAMIVLIWKVIPLFHQAGIVSIYEYLELRFDWRTRRFVSVVFLLSRALATGVAIYAVSIMVAVILDIPIFSTTLIIGVVAVIYDYVGGIKAVVYSDVIQMTIIVAGIIICLGFGIHYIGGWSSLKGAVAPDRLVAVDYRNLGLAGDSDFGFLPLLLGGFFLYMSYYGFDQSQVQRELSARSLLGSQKSLIFNALARYPIVLLYCMLGLVVGTFAFTDPGFMAMIPKDSVDYMIPVFVVHYLPAGISGFIVVAILSASLSSLDSALNSLSASTVEDILKPTLLKNAGDDTILKASKLSTLLWGVFCTGFAFLTGKISQTVIESINMIGSVFYGPIAAVFILGIFNRRVGSRDVIIGGITGVVLNLFLAAGFVKISWLWWNATGFAATAAVGLSASFIGPKTYHEGGDLHRLESPTGAFALVYLGLVLYGALIIILSNYLPFIIPASM